MTRQVASRAVCTAFGFVLVLATAAALASEQGLSFDCSDVEPKR
jgi:hypothetical protein